MLRNQKHATAVEEVIKIILAVVKNSEELGDEEGMIEALEEL